MLPPQPKNQLLDLARRLVGMPTGRATALLQPRFPARPVTLQNRVAGRPRDPVYPAKLAHRPIPGLEVRQKLLTLLHHSAHRRRHASLLHAFANGPKSVNQLPGLICKVSARSVPASAARLKSCPFKTPTYFAAGTRSRPFKTPAYFAARPKSRPFKTPVYSDLS